MSKEVSLVCHRGQPLRYPENSLEGYEFVLGLGAKYIETDINITADHIPILCHDSDVTRLTGKDLVVTENEFSQIKDLSAGYPERFKDKFEDFRISSLAQLSQIIKQWPEVIGFIEIKEESVHFFGHKAIDITISALKEVSQQCVLISFDYDALLYAKKTYDIEIGWVLPGCTVKDYLKAQKLNPKYLFVDTDLCPEKFINHWPGDWEWAVYTVNTATDVAYYASLGIKIIETDCYSELKE